MPYVVTQACCADASCVLACPVNCIHPAPGEPGFAEAEMLYVDPRACVDCGACATACPVDAIVPHTRLTTKQLPFIALNASYYDGQPHLDRTVLAPVPAKPTLTRAAGTRVAVVGAGPAALYAADALLKHPGVSVDLFDRLPTPYGLVRAGVAPDHPSTKQVTSLFGTIEGLDGFGYWLNVEIGTHLTLDQLAEHYHAVLYAVGASADRALGVPGEDLPGSESATAVVGWYNGHPDHVDTYVDLGSERVVVVGNGNVALDVARILTTDPDDLAGTDLAAEALATLRGSRVTEVVVLGRRGPADAAFTVPELVGLAGLVDEGRLDVVVDDAGEPVEVTGPKTALLAELAARTPTPGRRRLVLRFRSVPTRVVGEDCVEGVEVARTELETGPDGRTRAVATDEVEVVPASMVLRAVGYHGRPVADLPYDEASGTVPNHAGRVRAGVYVAGWVKRGPTGFIGTNKTCAEETVAALLADLEAGLLTEPRCSPAELEALLRAAQPDVLTLADWRALDRHEREVGAARGRVREKLTDVAEMVRVARAARGPDDGRPRARSLLRAVVGASR